MGMSVLIIIRNTFTQGRWFAALLAVIALYISFPVTTAAQAQPDQPLPQLTAEQIIGILQQNPDILAEAKARIASELQSRGYSVTVNEITDDRLFSEINSDERVRQTMSDFLARRGFGADQEEPATAAPGQANAPGQAPGQQPSGQQPAAQQPAMQAPPGTQPSATQPADRNARSNAPPRDRTRTAGSLQQQYPFRNMPSIRDMYTQSVLDPKKLDKLERFGAALFRNSAAIAEKADLDVPVGQDYVLGPGDEVVVQYWGSASQRLQLSVDREGRILLPEAGSVMVAGSTLDHARQLVHQAMQRVYRDVTVAISLGKLRMVRVYVVGDVVKPGAYEVSALSTPLSALLAAGGPTDSGSLRTVRHMRGNKLVEEVDLYNLLLKGMSGVEVRMESGDSILVPTIGPQVTVAGMVRRPAIYELRNETTLDQALELAGGVLVSGELGTIKVERIEAHEHKQVLSASLANGGADPPAIEMFKRFAVKDGDRVLVLPILPFSDKTVYLEGHVFRPGKYPFRDGLNVTDLIAGFDDLMPEPADRAEIVRLHAPDNRPYVIGFNLRDVLDKKDEAPRLQPFDTVRIYGRYEVDAPKVSVYGDVLRPGEYPLSERMSASDLLRLAGGFKRSAYTETADLASYSIVSGGHVEVEHREIPIARALQGEPDTDVRLKPGDSLTIRQLGGWADIGGAITVNGEVMHPGRYGIQEGDRLSAILKRAGGFLGQAYPNGAVLERMQVREIAAQSRDDLIRKLQAQAIEGGAAREPAAITRQRQALIDRLKQIQPSGRLLIHISPDFATWEGTDADIAVRPGDTLFIPKRPNFVQVAGQVYNPSAITFVPGRHAQWYLQQAGGATAIGNKKEAFVIRANGTVVGRASHEWWAGNAMSSVLQPGDTIYVPDKVSGGDRLKTLSQMAQMMSGLAVAAGVAFRF